MSRGVCDTAAESGQFSTVSTIWADGTIERPAPTPDPDSYLEMCREETGLPVPDHVVEKRRAQKKELLEQTFQLADKLEKEGIAAYRESQYFFWQFYVHSGLLEAIPCFRRIMFLPAVAAAVRAPMLSAVEYFCQQNPFCRFWTFTTGQRCTSGQLRKRIRYLHRKLSDLNAQPFMSDLGVEIVFRSTELGTPEFDADGNRLAAGKWSRIERGPRGECYYHPHAHCIVYLRKGFIRPDRWERLFRQIWDFWGHEWDGGKPGKSGVIRNARECVKYVTKPGEMLKLPGAELAAVHRALSRLKLAQPMGTLADEIAARRESGKRIVRRRSPNGEGSLLREVFDWNRKGPAPAPAPGEKKKEKREVFRVVSECLPAAGPIGLKEPRVILMTSFAHLTTAIARTHPLVEQIRKATAAEWSAGEAIRVHTCTSTVQHPRPERPARPRGRPRRARIGAARAGF